MTLIRWSTGETQPRLRYLELLLKAVPADKRALLMQLLQHRSLPPIEDISTRMPTIGYKFIKEIFEIRAHTEANLLFWALSHPILQHAAHLLDPEEQGLSLMLAQCTFPSAGMIRSLHSRICVATPPWETLIHYQYVFLGAESLVGHAVMQGHARSIDDLREQTRFLPVFSAQHEISAIAHPIFCTNRIAGCLYITSTQPHYFTSSPLLPLIDEYTHLLSLAFTNDEFYSPTTINLHWIPPSHVQRDQFTNIERSILTLTRTTGITYEQAEQATWQHIEENLLNFPCSPMPDC